MEGSATGLSAQPERQSRERSSVGWQLLWVLPHLAAVYVIVNFCTPYLAGWTRGKVLPVLQMRSASSQFEFLFSHLLAFSFIPAFLTGLANVRFKQKIAEFTWVVPTVVLAFKMATFSAPTSVVAGQSWSAFHQYFGGGFLIPEYRSWEEFWQMIGSNPDMIRGMAQHTFTAPFYAGMGYSVGAWLSRRTAMHHFVNAKMRSFEQRKFGVHS